MENRRFSQILTNFTKSVKLNSGTLKIKLASALNEFQKIIVQTDTRTHGW